MRYGGALKHSCDGCGKVRLVDGYCYDTVSLKSSVSVCDYYLIAFLALDYKCFRAVVLVIVQFVRLSLWQLHRLFVCQRFLHGAFHQHILSPLFFIDSVVVSLSSNPSVLFPMIGSLSFIFRPYMSSEGVFPVVDCGVHWYISKYLLRSSWRSRPKPYAIFFDGSFLPFHFTIIGSLSVRIDFRIPNSILVANCILLETINFIHFRYTQC